MRAHGMTFRLRRTSGPAGTEDLGGMGESTGVNGSPLPLEWTVISA